MIQKRNYRYEGDKVDIWSCGVVLFVLNAGTLPFNDPNLMEMYRKIYRGQYRCPRWTSPELRLLISRLLDTNPATRITVDGILHDPWFRKDLEEEKVMRLMRFHEEIEERISNVDSDDEADDRDLNAFDIISLSSGFDLSGLFNPAAAGRKRFLSGETVAGLLEKLEEVGRGEGLVVRRRQRGEKGRGGAAVEGRMGSLVAWVEVFRLSPELVVVEVESGCGEEAARWSAEFWEEKLAVGRLRVSASEPSTPVSASSAVGDSSSELLSPLSAGIKRILPASEPATPVYGAKRMTPGDENSGPVDLNVREPVTDCGLSGRSETEM
ncbi:CBL-interacting protein kinase 29 [Apostasia shenzhenica]|uniref:non-specific serine/threonine protein kinase n=1 Tax=Apostasia shenzhenica TaxID=1088818 RepID=A0A2I0AQ02_9ASPA|nr:CBL-interacting protein kinase 29 [Apostasia shenzhenica]